MFEMPEDARADQALRDGLRSLPVPEASADFDASIQAALRPRPSIWRALRSTLRPALPAAVCSMGVMLALLHWSEQKPVLPGVSSVPVTSRATFPDRLPANSPQGTPSDSLENADLTHASLSFACRPPHRAADRRG